MFRSHSVPDLVDNQTCVSLCASFQKYVPHVTHFEAQSEAQSGNRDRGEDVISAQNQNRHRVGRGPKLSHAKFQPNRRTSISGAAGRN